MTPALLGLLSAVIVAAGAALWLTRRRLAEASPPRRAAILLLRAASVACLLMMLANPIARRTRLEHPAPRVIVLVDRSASMGQKDGPGGAARAAWARGQLAPGGALKAALEGSETRGYEFAERAQEAQLPPNAAAEGAATDLDRALRTGIESDPAQPPDAVILLSDGAANRGPDREATVRWLARQRVPVFCIGVGSPGRPPDAWIARVEAPKTVRAGAECAIEVSVGSRGLDGKAVALKLSAPGLPSVESTAPLGPGTRGRLSLRLRPTQPGLYRCQVALAPVPGEWTAGNNRRTFFLRVEPGEPRLLLLAGSPSRELKFILRALEGMDDLKLTSLVRKTGGGFSEVGGSAAGGRPPTGRALDAYAAVVLQDVPAGSLTGAEITELARFVGERGGGLGVLGGSEALGGYGPGSLAPLLGVRIEGSSSYSTVPVKATEAAGSGELPPVQDIERHEDFPGWTAMPLLGGANGGAALRAGASAPLVTDQGGPLLVVQRYGSGRTLCLLTGGTYRWVLSRDATEASRRGHGAFWRGVAAWLTTPPNRTPVALETDRDVYEAGQTARLIAQVTDAGFRPLSGAQVVVTAEGTGGRREVPLAEVAGAPGRYEGGLAPERTGSVRLTATARHQGGVVGSDAREVEVEAAPLELAEPAQDVAFLRSIAEASGGAYLDAGEAHRLPRSLRLSSRERQVAVHVAWARSVWMLAALLALLTADWLLRRWWGVG